MKDKWTGAELKPGKPELCQGNGKHPEFECCCDECDYFLRCFPELKDSIDNNMPGVV